MRRAQVGDASGATSASVWWANHTRMAQRDAHRKMRLAKALERHEDVGEALAAGEILVDQAQVITDAVDALPDDVQPEEAKRLAAEERKAEQAARLTMSDDGHGQTHGRFTVPTGAADMFRKALQALVSPKAGGHGLTPHGMGLAFVEYIRRYPADRLPYAGGVSATVVVMMTLETTYARP